MYYIRILFSLLTLILSGYSTSIHAQELNAEVRILTPQLAQIDPEVFQDLELAVRDFLNSQSWTNSAYLPEERINCNFTFTIREELDQSTFTADLSIQATRPVYGSDYQTPLISHVDRDVKISYTPSQPILYVPNSFNDNLSSILAFYVYVIIGLDYDSFEQLGGDPYFTIAQEVMNNIPPAAASNLGGWQSLDGNRNRFWLIEGIFNPRSKPLREAMYIYHLEGLDVMFNNVQEGQQKILDALQKVQVVNATVPQSMIVQMFSNAKRDEVLDIMAKANRNTQRQVYGIMTTIDPTNVENYDVLK
jgi:hypothetical protein